MSDRQDKRDDDDWDDRSFGDESSRVTGRLKRFAQVGGGVGMLAAQLAGSRVTGRKLNREKHSAELKAALGSLKGPLMKAAQILATIPDALPEEYARELRQLQSNAPPMGWPFVRRRMKSELGTDWLGKFDSFQRTASAAASLGQVHRASLEGQELACKLQYPDMASTVEADVSQLKLAFSIYRRYDKAIDPSDIYKELSERLREELDYQREAKNMRLYQLMLAEEAEVAVPDPHEELSTARLLTMSWLEGQPLLDFVAEQEDPELRNRAAMNMFHAWYRPFYYYGVIHGDPHLGNYTLTQDAGVNLLDFGCIRVFRPLFVEGVIDLYHALQRDDRDLAIHAYSSWGFPQVKDNPELLEALNVWAHFLYKPLLEDRNQSILEGGRSFEGAEVAGKVHKELRRLGGVKPPREFVLMDRAAIGLGSVFMHLKAEINWHQLFHGLIDDFSRDKLEARQTAALTKVGLPLPE
ncbi:ABC1 kinase family protein [Rhodovibrionaceae bacterium A322]